MNVVFLVLVVAAFVTAAYRELTRVEDAASPMQALSQAAISSAGAAVELAIGLVGVMALFLGLMKIAEAGGLLTVLAKLLRPLMTRLFPDVPPNHPAMGAMILNFSANILGLGNAATPFGIRAMQELEKLNPHPGTATNAMAMFLAINTSSLTLLPTGVIALRASLGSENPAAILPTTLFATLSATTAAIIAVLVWQRLFPAPRPTRVVPATPPTDDGSARDTANAAQSAPDTPDSQTPPAGTAEPMPMHLDAPAEGYPLWVSLAALVGVLSIVPLTIVFGAVIAPWLIPALIVGFLLYGVARGVRIYEVFVEGAKEGFQVALRIIPYLVAILVAVGMLRESGALGAFVALLAPWTSPWGLPPEALPMALLRPFSGSGAYGIMAGIMSDPATGPDTHVGLLVSTLQGSTETTFYVLAVYFGAVGIRRVRHTLAAALTADVVGITAAVFIVAWLFL